MVINGKSIVFVNGRPTRVLGSRFNAALRKDPQASFKDEGGNPIVPSKGLSWADVASLVRSGKSAVATTGVSKPRRTKKPSAPVAQETSQA